MTERVFFRQLFSFGSSSTISVMRAQNLLALTALIVFLAYVPGLSGPWLFDDLSNIVVNKALDSTFSAAEDWREAAWSMFSGPLGRPVAALTFAMQAATGNLDPAASKLFNLLVHITCGLLVFFLTKNLLLSRENDQKHAVTAALVASVIWTLSPLQVSTVLYAVQRMAQLSTLFSLIGLLVFVRCRRRWLESMPSVDQVLACALWMALCTFLGAFSKENGALLLWLVVFVEAVWFRGVVAGECRKPLFFVSIVGVLAPTLIASIGLIMDPSWLMAGYDGRDFSLNERVFTQFRLLWLYVFWFLAPFPGQLGLFHDDVLWSSSVWVPLSTSVSIVAWGLGLLLALRFARWHPIFLLTIGWWWITHSLESSILPLEMVFEHRNYLPSVGLAIGVGYVLARGVEKLGLTAQKRVLFLLPLIFMLPLLMRTLSWSDESRLAASLCDHHPDSVRSCHFYAQTQMKLALEQDATIESMLSQSDRFLLARYALIKLHEEQPKELVTNAALFLLDSHSLPASDEVATLWVPRIIASLEENSLDVTEVNAVAQILQCYRASVCRLSSDQSKRLEEALLHESANFEAGFSELIAHYRDQRVTPAALVQKVEVLTQGLPPSLKISDWKALLYLENGDYPAFFTEMTTLAALDRYRLRYPKLSAAISQSGPRP